MKLSALNYVLFQAGWFACVMSAAHGQPLLGLIAVVLILGLHLSLARDLRNELKLVLACAAIGLVLDSLLLATGWVSYPNGNWIPGVAPYWIVALWLLFSTTLNLSMGWLKGRAWMAALLGAVGGPLSYVAGQKLGAIRLENPEAALVAIAIAWALVTPLLCLLAQRWNGFPNEQKSQPVLTGWREAGVNDHA